MKLCWKTALCALLVLAGCTRDEPLGIGRDLLPDDAVQTWEVTLDASRFIANDTAFGLYGRPADAPYILMANDYQGVLSSRTLVRFELPRTLIVRGAGDTLRVDSMPVWTAGSIALLRDTTITTAAGTLELRRTTQGWDRLTANWTYRVDSAGARLPWSQPGGSPGALISAVSYAANADSIVLPVDSATLALWADTTNAARGGIISIVTQGGYLRTPIPALRVAGRSRIRPDTVVNLVVAPSRTFIYTPQQPQATGSPRVGGVQQWRTLFALRESLDTVTVPCPSGAAGCRVRLGDVAINYAALVLQPVQAPAGFAPDRPLAIGVHGVLPNPAVPLQRSPITDAVGTTLSAIPVSSFTAAAAPAVEVPLTPFFRVLAGSGTSADQLPTHIALLQSGVGTFGFGTFSGTPRLRLILSTSAELQLP